MILLKKDKGTFTFRLPKWQKQLLIALLSRYPLIPPGHQPLSRSAAASHSKADQRLLDEALADHRKAAQEQIRKVLDDGRHLSEAGAEWHLRLNGAEIEWLLQVFNDIRVGCWVQLGSPETDLWKFAVDEKTALQARMMEAAGWFEAALLESIHPA